VRKEVKDMNNKELKEKLEKEWCLLAEDGKAYYRPFLCRGDPLKAKIALAGINPASPFTPDKISQEEYINLFSDYKKYMHKYMEFRGKESKTRKGINRLSDSIEPAINKTLGIANGKDFILETDVITYATSDTDELKEISDEIKSEGRKIFFDVFTNIQPGLLILYSKDALECFLGGQESEERFEIEYKYEISKNRTKEGLLKIRNKVEDFEKFGQPLFTIHFTSGNKCVVFCCRHLRFYNMSRKELENFQEILKNYIITTNCLC
jgi:hypothetical protein